MNGRKKKYLFRAADCFVFVRNFLGVFAFFFFHKFHIMLRFAYHIRIPSSIILYDFFIPTKQPAAAGIMVEL